MFFMVCAEQNSASPAQVAFTFRKSGATTVSRGFQLPSTVATLGLNWARVSSKITYGAGTALPDSVIISFISSYPVTSAAFGSFLAIDDISFSKGNPASVGDITLQPMDKLSDVSVYPNPANSTATLKYKTGELSHVAVELYDIAGRKVASLYEGSEGAGEHTLPINIAQFNNGLYIYRVMADGVVTTGKLIISK
jgi:hypothetical protein